MAQFDVRSIRGKASGDQYSDWIDEKNALAAPAPAHPLDSEESRKEHRRLLEWYFLEREKQSENRLECALDHDFYDGLQWDPEDSQALRDRGQMPLVYNEISPMIDWIIGTERRARVDWKVLPRTEDDVEGADAKTKVMKFVSDLNRVVFARSKAFADAAKGGVGWLDDGVRDDPSQDVIYSKYEDWRNVLWDSASYELDLSDARYIFRWRWVDEDIALMMFPDRRAQILQAIEDAGSFHTEHDELDSWNYNEETASNERLGRITSASGSGVMVDAKRRRIKLIEAQYRKPTTVKVVGDGPMKGAFFDPRDEVMAQALASTQSSIIDRVMMRVHFAVFTESALLSMNPSIYRHNKFGLTPIWCYRRNRDRLPYGAVRRVRDIQQDLNKRASKALFLLNSNQIFAEEGATDDWNNLRDEVDRPDGMIVTKPGRKMDVRRDTDAATGQIQMMTLDAQSIQKTAGVSNENLGRQTNAVSGEAIKARQLQGSVVTTEPFDNLRLAIQIQGEKQLSLIEQFYTEEKVLRLTGSRGAIEWVSINKPEQQPDGSVRYINDITNRLADFVVSEQDYAGTLRQVMFDSLNQIVQKLPPEVGLRIFTIAMEFSDLPNKDEIADAVRRITGERDPNKEMTPEEAQQAEEQMRQQAEAMQMQREAAITALEEQKAKVRQLNAQAAKLEAEAGAAEGGVPGEIQREIMKVQQQAADQIDALSDQLRKAQMDAANKTMAINRDADTKMEAARIQADAQVRVAEIQQASDRQIAALEKRIEAMLRALDDAKKETQRAIKDTEAKVKADADKKEMAEKEKEKPAKEAAPAPAPAAPMTFNIQVDAKPAGSKTITLKKDKDGNVVGGTVEEKGEGK